MRHLKLMFLDEVDTVYVDYEARYDLCWVRDLCKNYFISVLTFYLSMLPFAFIVVCKYLPFTFNIIEQHEVFLDLGFQGVGETADNQFFIAVSGTLMTRL